jgi:hypothetical protein
VELEAETQSLEREIEQLEHGDTPLIAWTAIDQRIGAAMLAAQSELQALQRSMVVHVRQASAYAWVRAHNDVRKTADVLERLRVLRMRVQSRIYEHHVTAQQTTHMRFQ